MIEKNNLKIGNWIDVGISQPSFVAIPGGKYIDNNYKTASPIYITEQILLQCGFKEYGDREWLTIEIGDQTELSFTLMHDNLWEEWGLWKNEDELLNGGWFYFTAELKYIHQLQNFYFALTGKELEVKL